MREIVSFRLLTLVFTLTLIVSTAAADQPLPPPSTHAVTSSDKAIVVVSSPDRGTRVLERATRKALWSMPGWYRWLFVSNDGDYVVTGYDGMNLVPADYTDDLVLLTFWHRGKKIRKVTLKEIVPEKSILVRTVSHYHWGTIEGINDKGELVVKRSDGQVLVYDVATGVSK